MKLFTRPARAKYIEQTVKGQPLSCQLSPGWLWGSWAGDGGPVRDCGVCEIPGGPGWGWGGARKEIWGFSGSAGGDTGCCWGLQGTCEIPGWLCGRAAVFEKVLEGLCGVVGDTGTWGDMGTRRAGAECCSGERLMWASGGTWGTRTWGGMGM